MGRFQYALPGSVVFLGMLLWFAAPMAYAVCGKECKEAKNYCDTWERDHPGETCGTVRGAICTSSSWDKIKQVNWAWSACKLVKGKDDMARAQERCDEHETYWGKGDCQVQSPRCKAGWVKIADYGKIHACRKLQPSGNARYDAYKAFMRQWEGKAQVGMHPALRDFVKRHYTIDPNRVRWGLVSNPHATCTTDCYNIYCKRQFIIDDITSGMVRDDIVFHELAHVEQCEQRSGRKNYALMWFGDLPIGFFKALKPDIKDEFKDKIHDRMPMEQSAESKAIKVYQSYTRDWWHKTAHCRIYKADRRTVVYTSNAPHSRVFCDPKYNGQGWPGLQTSAKKAAQKHGDGTYHYAFGRPDAGQGVWLTAENITVPRPRTGTSTRRSSARPPVRSMQ